MNAKFRIAYRKGDKINGITGYEYTITDATNLIVGHGWSAGRKADAVAEAERALDALVKRATP